MRVLFISPQTTVEDRYGGVSIADKEGYLPPIGLLQIAAVLEEENHNVKVLDLSLSDYPLQEVKETVRNFSPEIVCFTILSLNASKAFEISKVIDEMTNSLIVFGGPHALVFSEKILQEQKQIDVLVIGEGEYTMLKIAEAVKNRKSFKNIKGIYFRDNKSNIVKTSPGETIKNLDKLPFPAYHLLDLKKYVPLPHHYKRLPAINVVTSRGCSWGQCTFCFESIRLGHFRRTSPQRIIDLIKMLTNTYGIKEISFWDDLFTISPKWVNEFCNLIKEEGIDITWSCYAKVDTVNLPLLKTMASAGCWNIFYGLESGNQDLLDKIKKGATLEQAIDAIKWSKQAGIETRGAFMFALPGETPEKAEKTIEFAMKLDLDYIQFGYTTPYYGTELYNQCLNEGKLDDDLDKYSTFEPVYLPKGYESKEQLKKIFKKAYRKVYLRPRYIFKKISAIGSFNDLIRLYRGFRILVSFLK